MDTISAALLRAYPKAYSASAVVHTPMDGQLLGQASTRLYILLGAVSFVLPRVLRESGEPHGVGRLRVYAAVRQSQQTNVTD